MFKPIITTCVLSAVLFVPTAHSTDSAANATQAIATVNGQPITQQDFDDYLKSRSTQTENQEASPKPELIISELINRELIKQDSIKQGIEQNLTFIKKLGEIRNELLMSLALQNYLEKHPLEEAALKREYELRVAEAPNEYKVSHILVNTEEAANAILTELKAGKDFGELAKAKSLDSESAKNGGDLGWVNRQKVVSEFADSMEKMKTGELSSAPVKTQFGWHLLQVQDIRKMAAPTFEQVKDRLKSVLQSQQMQEYINGLKKEAKIEVLKTMPPATTAPTVVPKPD